MKERNLNEGQWEDRKQRSLGVGQRRKSFKTDIYIYIYIYILQHLLFLLCVRFCLTKGFNVSSFYSH